jgi:hypothetical protein
MEKTAPALFLPVAVPFSWRRPGQGARHSPRFEVVILV